MALIMQSNNYKLQEDICEYIRGMVARNIRYNVSYTIRNRVENTNSPITNILFEIYEAVVYDV